MSFSGQYFCLKCRFFRSQLSFSPFLRFEILMRVKCVTPLQHFINSEYLVYKNGIKRLPMLQVSMAFSLSMNEFGVTLHVTVKVAKIFNSFFSAWTPKFNTNLYLFCYVKMLINHWIDFKIKRASRTTIKPNANEWLTSKC